MTPFKALEALLVSNVFDSFDVNIGRWYLVTDIPCDRLATIEIPIRQHGNALSVFLAFIFFVELFPQ
jgi:hypothetical protein